MGEDRRGRVRTFGLGVTPSDIYGPRVLVAKVREIANIERAQRIAAKQRVVAVEDRMRRMEARMHQMMTCFQMFTQFSVLLLISSVMFDMDGPEKSLRPTFIEFDLEAAVKEIDFVCQVVALTSNGENFKSKSSKPKTFVGSRQSTLDKFVRTGGRSSVPHVFHIVNGNSFDMGDDGICTRIDFFIILYSRQGDFLCKLAEVVHIPLII